MSVRTLYGPNWWETNRVNRYYSNFFRLFCEDHPKNCNGYGIDESLMLEALENLKMGDRALRLCCEEDGDNLVQKFRHTWGNVKCSIPSLCWACSFVARIQ
jgi:hypothetical protein